MSLTRRHATRLLLSAAAGAALPAIPSGSPLLAAPAETPVRGGTLNWVFFPEPQAIIAINTTSGTGQTIGSKINEGLLRYATDMTPLPNLATEWAISPDGLRYRFVLRRGVTWHDGQPFTAADVAFSLLRLREAHPRGRITFANVAEVRTPDSHSVEIVLSRPAPFLISAFVGAESPIFPRHVYEAIRPEASASLAQTIGTGPFLLKEWVPGSHLLFERNPNYWDEGKPCLDRIVMRIITDPGARAAAFEAGEVDLGGNPVPLADLAACAPCRSSWSTPRPTPIPGRRPSSSSTSTPACCKTCGCAGRWRTPSTSRHCWRRCISGTARSRRPPSASCIRRFTIRVSGRCRST
ncbi:hypothetical protein mvi_23120 [Methylobacterium indicum]|uniref:Solute-binding protein family 5 domain-containing protein n=1 Tax=Methylobacterium indicum TaxID=1775910 RepID=A0A8H9C6L7_9HYPH|nr:hypothetical protein mvi_23120 [Methylobacterium indicum]